MAHLARDHRAIAHARVDQRPERGVAEPGDAQLEVQLLIERRRAEEANTRLRDHHVGAGFDHGVVVPDRLAPELRDDHVEERKVVRVEHDTLRVALAIPHAESMTEDPWHARSVATAAVRSERSRPRAQSTAA